MAQRTAACHGVRAIETVLRTRAYSLLPEVVEGAEADADRNQRWSLWWSRPLENAEDFDRLRGYSRFTHRETRNAHYPAVTHAEDDRCEAGNHTTL
jgi:hypothetical protein